MSIMPSIKMAVSPEHQELVKALIDKLAKEGFKILEASYEGYPEPRQRGRHEPDVYAYKYEIQLEAIGEAKLCEDLDTERTKEQFKDFSSRYMPEGKSRNMPVPFYIAVPQKCKQKAHEKLVELGLAGRANVSLDP